MNSKTMIIGEKRYIISTEQFDDTSFEDGYSYKGLNVKVTGEGIEFTFRKYDDEDCVYYKGDEDDLSDDKLKTIRQISKELFNIEKVKALKNEGYKVV